jgi:GH25 family lysozyme M1 (1,4-beta-N-acetylmuramidase)
MALGIDIYRYQTVTDWAAVKRHGVSYVYVKATDGGGYAMARADGQVRGAQSVGIPVGLYHFAQRAPSPEAQADILAAECRRLDTTLPPALDLEDDPPHGLTWPRPEARQFALRFIARLRWHGFDQVTLYASVSMLHDIGAPAMAETDPGLVIWAAAYGRNDGKRYPLAYRGRANIHQYTSVGAVPGITGRVDLNELLIPLGDKDMPLSDQDFIKVWYTPVITLDPGTPQAQSLSGAAVLEGMARFVRDQAPELLQSVREQADDQDVILAAVRLVSAGGDPVAFAAALAPILGPLVQAGASEEQVRQAVDEEIKAAFARAAGA